MVLRLKTRESRSLPGLLNATQIIFSNHKTDRKNVFQPTTSPVNAGWSSPVARQAHNLKAAGSNPAPATNHIARIQAGFFCATRFNASKAAKTPKAPKADAAKPKSPLTSISSKYPGADISDASIHLKHSQLIASGYSGLLSKFRMC